MTLTGCSWAGTGMLNHLRQRCFSALSRSWQLSTPCSSRCFTGTTALYKPPSLAQLALDDQLAAARELQQSGEALEAVRAYEGLTRAGLGSISTDSWIGLAESLQCINRHSEAAAAFLQAHTLTPENIPLLVSRVKALLLAGDAAEAERCCSQAIELVGTGAPQLLADLNVLLADCAQTISPKEALPKYARAIQLYNASAEDRPSPLHAHAERQQRKLTARLFWESAAEPVVVDPAEELEPYKSIRVQETPFDDPENPLWCVHQMEFLNRETCDWLIEAVELHTAAAGGWSTDRHQDYTTQDLELSNVPAVRDWMAKQLRSAILPTLARLYHLPPERLLALDVFIVKYSVDVQPGLALHRDSQSFSFNVGISDHFEGGGTRFETLGETVRMDGVGDMLMHCGRMLHGGAPVTAGLRYILVGFVQVVEPTLIEDRTRLEVSNETSGPFASRPMDGVALDDHWEAMQT